jgi:hypothetical protein
MKKLLAISLTALLMTQIVLAIGVSPAKISIEMSANSDHEFEIRIVNNEKMNMQVDLSAEGGLAEFIRFERNHFRMGEGDDIAAVKAVVSVPQGFNRTDERYKTSIIVMAKPAEQDSMINVVGAVIANVYVNVVPEILDVSIPEFQDSRSTEVIPTPKGGEELSNDGGFVVEKSPQNGSLPYLSYLFMIAIVFVFAMLALRHYKNEKKYK